MPQERDVYRVSGEGGEEGGLGELRKKEKKGGKGNKKKIKVLTPGRPKKTQTISQ